MDADVIVIGCGTMGSFTLWRLASRGVRALGIEQFEPGHDRGSGHGESRIIRTASFESSSYIPLVQSAFTLWRKLEEESGASLLTMTGGLMIGHPDSPLIKGTLRSFQEHDLAHVLLRADELSERYPQHSLQTGEVAVYEKGAGVLRPERAIETAVHRAEDLGAKLLRNTKVERLRETSDGVEVEAGGHTYRARRAIVAAGAWTAKLLDVDLPLAVERQVLAWFPAEEPDLFAPDRFPICIRQQHGYEWYVFPSLDGATVKAAVHHHGKAVDPDDLDREIKPEDVESVSWLVKSSLPGLLQPAVRAQVCMYTNTPDEHFLVGLVPKHEKVLMLGGFSGHGFKFAPVMGEIAADLSVLGETKHPIEDFSTERFIVQDRS